MVTEQTDDEWCSLYERRICSYFKKLRFPDFLQGTGYCKEAVLYAVINNEQDLRITHDIYVYVAERYSTTPQNVERLIRIVIERVWLRMPLGLVRAMYPYYYSDSMGRPTNGDFILNIAHLIMNQQHYQSKYKPQNQSKIEYMTDRA